MISAPLRRSVCRRFRAAAVWAMLPLVLLSGQPVFGCICADGRYEPFCRIQLWPGSQTDARQPTVEKTRCGRSCCEKGAVDQGARDCCKGETNGCGQSDGAAGGKGCTPIVKSQVVPPVVTPQQIADQQDVPAVCPAHLNASSISLTIGRHWELDTGLPPVDLVVILQRLVI
jgi:hypothetical protein